MLRRFVCSRGLAATLLMSALLIGCGGGGGGRGVPAEDGRGDSAESGGGGDGTAQRYSVGVKVTGLSGSLILQNNDGDDLTISKNGDFVFAKRLNDGDRYAITIRTQPDGQTCTIIQGSGTVDRANVTGVSVICAGSVAKTCDDYNKSGLPNLSQTQPYHTLAEFAENATSFSYPYGTTPESGLVEGPDGNFYGVNSNGGVNASGRAGEGLVYRISPDGAMSQVHVFEYLGDVGMHGKNPRGGLTLGSDCYLYGTTDFAWGDGEAYQAAIFKMSLEGNIEYLAGLHHAIHGASPLERLLEGSDGNFYGTSYSGGAHYNQIYSGTVFKMTPDGNLTTLHSFSGANGGGPRGTLVEGDDGNFYGVTETGGMYGGGTVYRVSPSGNHTILHAFNQADGRFPFGGLTKGEDGSFYGTTRAGGLYGHGVIFRITPTGVQTVLYPFNNTTPDLGCNCGIATPQGDLILARDGFFYGVAEKGASYSGSGEGGAVFRVSAEGHFSPVVYFPAGGARNVDSGLIQGSDGHLYGASFQGGQQNRGLIFRVLLP